MPTTFAQLISDPAAVKIFLLEADYFDLTTRTTGTLKVLSQGRQLVAGGPYETGLDVVPWLQRDLFAAGGRIGGRAAVSIGEAALNNTDGGFDRLANYAFDGRAFALYVGGETYPGLPWARADFVEILTGVMASHVVGMETVTLQPRDERVNLDVPLLTDFYKGLGACLLFDGVNDKAVSASTFAPSTSLTVEFRLRALNSNTAGTAQVLLYHASAWTSAGIDWYFQVDTSGVLSAVIQRRSGGAASTLTHSGVDVRDSAWRHVALTIDTLSGAAILYVDGVSVATGSAPTLTSAVCELGVGTLYGGGSNFSNAEVDEVRYWSLPRTATQIADHKDRTVDPASSGLVHYWRIDEATGATVADEVSTGAIGLTITGATWVSTYEGREDLAGKTKPRTLGPADNVEGVLVDPQLNIWQFHNGRVRKFRNVYWRGVLRTEGVDYTVDLGRGCITALTAVDGVVTADIDGEAEGGYIDAAADILRRLLAGYSPLTGDCLSFDGVDDSVSASPTCPAGSMTLEAMALTRVLDSGAHALFGFRDGTNAGLRLLYQRGSDNKIVFSVRNDAATLYEAGYLPRINKWARWSGVLDVAGGNIYLYEDGALRATTAIAGTFNTATANFAVGKLADAASAYWSGRLDDLRIWNTTRAVADIKDYAWQELVGNEAGLTQNWKLNDGAGTSAANAVSGGATGTVSGATWLTSADPAVTVSAAPFDFTTLRGLNSAAVAHHWSDSTTKLAAVSEVADGPGFFHVYEGAGDLRVGRVDVPAASKLGASAVRLDGGYSGSVFTSLKATGAASIDVTDCAFTFECWVYPFVAIHNGVGAQTIASQRTYIAGPPFFLLGGWRLELIAGVPSISAANTGGSASVTATEAIPLRAWTHLAVSSEPTTANKFRLLVNGEVVGAATLPAGTFGASNDLWIGSTVGQLWPFVGIVDEARLWNQPRTAASVVRDMLQEVSAAALEVGDNGSACSLQAYWPMNAASGSQANDSVGSAHLVFQGSPAWCRPVAAEIHWTDVVGDPQVLDSDIPHALVRVGWGPNFRTMSDDEVADSVTPERRAFLTEELRWATSESVAAREAHLLTRELDAVRAHFSTEPAAKAEAVRQAVIAGRERHPLSIEAVGVFASLEPGDLVRLYYPRRGMDTGSDFLVLGVRDDPNAAPIATGLTLWQ